MILRDIGQSLAQREKEKEQILIASRINSVVDEDDFLDNLQEISTRIPSKEYRFGAGREGEGGTIEELMTNRNAPVRKAL